MVLQLWGKIEHVEAPGPNELVHFKASQQAQHAATTEQLSLIGNQVRILCNCVALAEAKLDASQAWD